MSLTSSALSIYLGLHARILSLKAVLLVDVYKFPQTTTLSVHFTKPIWAIYDIEVSTFEIPKHTAKTKSN